ncbi:MAG: methionyl-tRNA formyltransferase [Armatimonadetes bacterium]|nr:methionyl-tRNA formyltransferase [Armatimonadota bacterium]
MRIVFMGTAAFACLSLKALIESSHEVAAVVTQPDRPKGRGLEMSACRVKVQALAFGQTPVLQPEKVRREEFLSRMEAIRPDLIVVAAFGQILPKRLLDMPPLGCVNVHASLLPRYRGAAPAHHVILNGETETGVTLMFMDETLDTGDIICQERIPILPEDNRESLEMRLAQAGADLLARTLPLLESSQAPRTPQNHAEATYAPMIRREDGLLGWSQPADALHNRVRAFTPSPGAFTYFRGQAIKLWQTEAQAGDREAPEGAVLRLTRQGPLVQAGEGRLLLKEVQPESRKRLSGEEYARGYRITIGEIFGFSA